jgi:hypothetical protein
MKEIKIENNSSVPDHEIEALARCFLPALTDFYKSEEGQKAYEEWRNERSAIIENGLS